MPETPGEKVQDQLENEVKPRAFNFLRQVGESSGPPVALATLIAAQNLQPFKPLPMLFPPALLFTSYMNISGYEKDAAGASGAFATLYAILASRRKQGFTQKFKLRGLVRGVTILGCAVQGAAGLFTYAIG